MPIDIHGWVEVCRDPSLKGDQWGWSGLINISPLIDGSDEVSATLFGISKSALSTQPIAAKRGLPNCPSPEVSQLATAMVQLSELNPGVFLGFTWATIDEIETLDWQQLAINFQQSDWATLHRLIRALRADERFSAAEFRIVVAATWG